MPLTDTLENAKRLEEADFPPKQAKALSVLLEETAAASQTDLKEYVTAEGERTRAELRTEMTAEGERTRAELRTEIAAEGKRTRDELRAEFRAEIAAEGKRTRAENTAEGQRTRAEFQKELRLQVLWFFAMLVAVFSAAFTLAKVLF